MSTKGTIWYGTDERLGSQLHSERGESGLHLYWELAERIPGKAAPIYLHIEGYGKEATIRLPKEIAQQVRDVLDPAPGGMEVL
jgi:hypothetical protein